MADYYVYVYIDPRNFEEFYYGKGRGSRKDAHLFDTAASSKTDRIKAIRKAGLEPIIRVIARGLTEAEALLVEKTLLWKLGKLTTNIATGHFAEKFRPHDTMHQALSGFDFQNGLYYYNVGEGEHRNWDDYRRYGFISGGQGIKYREAMQGFNTGDVFAAYLKGRGFVGIGRITARAEGVRDIRIDKKPLLSLDLVQPRLGEHADDPDRAEYVCLVEWLKAVPREEAQWRQAPKLYTTTHLRASLDRQPETVEFLERAFDIALRAGIV